MKKTPDNIVVCHLKMSALICHFVTRVILMTSLYFMIQYYL